MADIKRVSESLTESEKAQLLTAEREEVSRLQASYEQIRKDEGK